MKGKIIILSLALVAILCGVVLKSNNTSTDILKVAFPYDKEVHFYEPTKIHLGPEYIFLENTFSPLIELDPKEGTPVSGIAKEFVWKGNELHLFLREDLKTIDGYTIDAYDAEFSLKRLLVLASNTHGNFKDLICPDYNLKDIESHCSGIEVKSKFHLVLLPEGNKSFLAPMLSAIDFAVIPKKSIDAKTLKITDYRNTSGPYFVEESFSDGRINLRANPNHYHYKKSMPQKIEIVSAGIGGRPDSLTLYAEGKVDHITTVDKLNPDKVIRFSKNDKSSELHLTMNLRTFALFFTEKGLRRFDEKKRMAIGKTFQKIFRDFYKDQPGFENHSQLFMAIGDGGLSESDLASVTEKFKEVKPEDNGDGLFGTLLRLGNIDNYKEEVERLLPGIRFELGKNVPSFSTGMKEEDLPDFFIGGPDVSFSEDISLISYSVNAGIFGLSKNERQQWLKEYMQMPSKEERIKKLEKLHLEALNKAIIVPFVSSPYVALTRKPWSAKLPTIFANNLLWRIKK